MQTGIAWFKRWLSYIIGAIIGVFCAIGLMVTGSAILTLLFVWVGCVVIGGRIYDMFKYGEKL